MNLLDYWNQRADVYSTSDVVGRQILQAHIQQIQPKSLVEIGCGNGILFSLYKNIPRVSAMDFSAKMLERAEDRCQRHNYPFSLFLWDITETAPVNHWDLAVTRTCLMHIPPERIEQAIINIGKICDKALIFEYWEPLPSEPLSSHNWLHDYTLLFEAVGFVIEDVYVRGDKPQALFIFRKTENVKHG